MPAGLAIITGGGVALAVLEVTLHYSGDNCKPLCAGCPHRGWGSALCSTSCGRLDRASRRVSPFQLLRHPRSQLLRQIIAAGKLMQSTASRRVRPAFAPGGRVPLRHLHCPNSSHSPLLRVWSRALHHRAECAIQHQGTGPFTAPSGGGHPQVPVVKLSTFATV